MQTFNTRRSLLALSALGFALLPLCGAVEAQGQSHGKGRANGRAKGAPPAHAPAYGRRERNDDRFERGRGRIDDRDDDRFDDRDDDRGGGRGRDDNYGRIVTLEAVVTRVGDNNRSGTNDFRVQSGGRSFDVSSDSRVRVFVGQRVILRGSFDRDDNFNARSVTVSGRANDNRDDNDPYRDDFRTDSERRVNFPGVVTRVLGNGEFEVRAENGRVYRVESRSNSNDFRVGSRVRVTGDATGTRVQNARVVRQNGGVGGILGDIFGGGTNNDADYGDFGAATNQKVNFAARIVRISSDRRNATVRGDNGRQYTIRSTHLKNYRDGERIRVSGTTRNGVVEVSDIDRI